MASLASRPRRSSRRIATGMVALAKAAGSLLTVDAREASAATVDPNAWYALVNRGDDNSLPWRLALLTQTNSTC